MQIDRNQKVAMVIILVVGALVLPAGMKMPFAHAQSQDVPAKVTITGSTATCGFQTTTDLDFGVLANQQLSADQTFEISSTGTSTINIDMYGTVWNDDFAGQVMPAEATRFGSPGNQYDIMTPVTETPTHFAILHQNDILTTVAVLKADLTNNPSFTGAAYQTITFSGTC